MNLRPDDVDLVELCGAPSKSFSTPRTATSTPITGPRFGRRRFFSAAADAIVAAVPGAERGTLERLGHVADPSALSSALTRFFTA